ncbi:site-specific integrase [Hydrogenophaga sp.]|uniref:tyrosine-type recombinase/integrase n=1 Tax=Hydrogenophaga sp. TaxID=1904254 RepID=UPI002BD0F409|nr:site-specific integrase [Hydrogenophaga sp.]HMP09196.1 site-specific integrase [Hydrogenophaga sp.]
MGLITVQELKALTPDRDGERVAMGGSMYGTVRAGSDGAVSVHVVWRYRFNAKVRQIRLGTWRDKGGESLKALRDKRDTYAGEVKSGIDPIDRRATDRLRDAADAEAARQAQVDRLQALAAASARMTVRELFELWHRVHLAKPQGGRKDGGAEALRAFEKDVFPHIGNMAAKDVRKADVLRIIDDMTARGVTRMTKRVFSDLRQMFELAVDREIIELNPTARIKKKKDIGDDTERDRFLSERELVKLFEKLPDSGLTDTAQLALKIQLATITRIGEVSAARWDQVDLERRVWTLPTTKNGKAHRVHISDFALTQFQALQAITGAAPWLFPNSKLSGPIDSKTFTKQVADRQREEKPMTRRTKQIDALALEGGQWRPHDLRRTGATMMALLGVLPDVVERCLNHKEQNRMKRIYQHAGYEAQMREAWDLLGLRLALLKNKPENVRTLKRA